MSMDPKQMSKAAGAATGKTGTSVAVKSAIQPPSVIVGNMLAKYGDAIKQALPAVMTPERFTRLAVNAIAGNPKMMQAVTESPQTLVGAVMTCAQLGLEPNTPLGLAYILPFNNFNKAKGKKEMSCTFQLGYQGVLALARRSGEISTIQARVVYANDEFDYEYGLKPFLRHKPCKGANRGEAVAYYATFTTKDGGDGFEVMWKEDVLEHAKRFSKSYYAGEFSGPWATDFDSMAKKGLSLDTMIPTPDGWVTMGEIEKGMTVFDMLGRPTKVIAVSEEKNIDCYEVTFANGEKVVCDDEHQWTAAIGTNGSRSVKEHGWKSYTVNDLMKAKDKGERIIVPVIPGICTKKANLPIDPWVLGYWLGNGHSQGACVSCAVDDSEFVKSRIAAAGYTVGVVRKDPRSNTVTIGIKGGLKASLKELGLLGNKRIPDVYLRADANQRLELLKGLMDSDGTIDTARGRAIFTTVREDLCVQVMELVSSLGELVSRSSTIASGYGKRVRCYALNWQPITPPVSMPRKLERVRDRIVLCSRGVKSIKKIPSVTTKCIAVDSNTKTYLVTKSFIPTHNTVLLAALKYAPKATDFARDMSSDNLVKKYEEGKDMRDVQAEEVIDVDAEVSEPKSASTQKSQEAPKGESDELDDIN